MMNDDDNDDDYDFLTKIMRIKDILLGYCMHDSKQFFELYIFLPYK